MKKKILILAFVALALLACGKKNTTETKKNTESTTEVKVGEDGEKESSKGTDKAKKEEKESESTAKGKESGGKERKDLTVISGTITDAAMNTVSVKGKDGKDYELNKTGKTDISGLSQGIEIGIPVEVTFDKDMNIISMVDPGK
ncbi:MAG: hypothetical protein HXK77_04115 [Lachnospiraceae bacterium]|nr:hypothetical protein [Lachnospiraceae bacterium]